MPSPETGQSHHLWSTKWNQSLSADLSPVYPSFLSGKNIWKKLLHQRHRAESAHTLHLSSQCLAKFNNKPCLAALTSIKLHSKSLSSSYGPAAERCLNIQNKAFEPTSTDISISEGLGRMKYSHSPPMTFIFTYPTSCLPRKCTQQETQHPEQTERGFCSTLLSPARTPSSASHSLHCLITLPGPRPNILQRCRNAFCPKTHNHTWNKMGTAPNLPQEAWNQAGSKTPGATSHCPYPIPNHSLDCTLTTHAATQKCG